ncbi:hypothetical protein JYU14_04310 [Simkania negevensis]|uniref:Phophatidylinositol-4-phosphate 5-kinase n=1 Tax=Simkania negevensis TaxID=83561 RepID=A0ABS3AT15_9BACT|nr:hypothetical protein [Simkania negevensis]
MKGKTPLIALLFITLVLTAGCSRVRKGSRAPTLISIQLIDRNGMTETTRNKDRLSRYEGVEFLSSQPYQKVTRTFRKEKSGEEKTMLTSYHSNGRLRQYLEAKEGRAHGLYREWYENGVLKAEASVVEGVADLTEQAERSWAFDGKTYAWNEKGGLVALIPYDQGAIDGIATYYHSNGNLWKIKPFTNNKKEGKEELYSSDGALLQETFYLNDFKEGPSIRHREEGSLLFNEHYREGLLESGEYYKINNELIAEVAQGAGKRALFNEEGILTELVEYQQGVPHGTVQLFTEWGELMRSYQITNGLKQGKEIEYIISPFNKKKTTTPPRPKLLLSWHEGMLHGPVQSWYPNGQQESSKEMERNNKQGLAFAWYEDGSLMLAEEYNKELLIRGEYYSNKSKKPVSTVNEGKGVTTLFDSKGNLLEKIPYDKGLPQLQS